MDRTVVYPAALPQDTDILQPQRNAMIALGFALQATFGTNTLVDGLTCTQSSPTANMYVNVGPGSIIQQSVVDQNSYGSLAADSADALVKMGINLTSTSIGPFTAPGTSGYSQNFLIQAALSETDTNPVVLPYYNASNPSAPYAGPYNDGAPQDTARKQTVNLQIKAGSAAATGTQVTPSPDTGYVGLWVVTIANGQSSITNANIVQYPNAPFITNKVGSGSISGHNYLHNARFNIQQRGTGPWTTSGSYTADRWLLLTNHDTDSVSILPMGDADRAAVGDESALYALQDVFTGSSTSGAYSVICQRIEGVRRLSGKTVVLSFWARATSGTPTIIVSAQQNFGTGGSPSATVDTSFLSETLSSTWTHYWFTNTLPSASGKTFGTTAGTDFTEFDIFLSDQGAGLVQSGTVQFWGMKLELGSVATALDTPDPEADLAMCQRFYEVGTDVVIGGYVASGSSLSGYVVPVSFAVPKRALPTMSSTFYQTPTNMGSVVLQSASTGNFALSFGVAAAGAYLAQINFTATADL